MAVTSTNNLRKGSKGSDVLELQKLLNQNGYNLAEDGSFGGKTLAAVQDYQKKNGLVVDGIVGTNTWGALTGTKPAQNTATTSQNTTAQVASPSPSQTTSSGFQYADYQESDTVKQAQEMLNQQLQQKPGEYQSTWQDQLNETISQILNRDKFSYDLNGDALYQQYKDQYVQQGKMAMMDTMGQAQAMTGGYGNSYAQSAGQQAYQGYLQQLNEVVPELYGMALDQYNQEGQDMYNQASLMAQQEDRDYGRYQDAMNAWLSERDYLAGRYDSERSYDYGQYTDNRDFSYGSFIDDRNYQYQKEQDALTEAWRQKEFEEAQRKYNEQMALTKEQWAWEKEQAAAAGSSGSGNNSGNSGDSGNSILWYYTGTHDDKGNPIFRNSDGKTQAFGQGVNPYTGTKNPDVRYGRFDNGYQPDNINGTRLENTGMTTSITGKEQTIWKAKGKYWLWNDTKNKYEEVEVEEEPSTNSGVAPSGRTTTAGGMKFNYRAV